MENITHELLAVSRAAKVLHIGKDTMYKLIADGRIGFIEIGKRKKIPYTELQNFQQRNITYSPILPDQGHSSEKVTNNILQPRKNSMHNYRTGEEILESILRRT